MRTRAPDWSRCRVGRALEWAEEHGPEPGFGSDPARVFGEVVAPVGHCSLTVVLNPESYGEAFAGLGAPEAKQDADDTSFEGLMGMLRDGLYYEFGVYLPKAGAEEEHVFTGSVMRFRLNDRRLLPQAGLESGHAMVSAYGRGPRWRWGSTAGRRRTPRTATSGRAGD